MATNLAKEQAEQRRWPLRPEWASVNWFDCLVNDEFRSPQEQRAVQARTLAGVIHFCSQAVPFYQERFRALGLTAREVCSAAGWARLPALTKTDLQQHDKLRAVALPPGEQLGALRTTSGTTGQPVQVMHTRRSLAMFAILKQRELRWYRLDPAGAYGWLRPTRDLPRLQDGQPIVDGDVVRRSSWPLVGDFFHTGPFTGFSSLVSLDRQMAWFERERPDHLLVQSADLEHLALGYQGRPHPGCLKTVLAISQQLTSGMRQRIEATFGVTVEQNYGLNEIGLVASRCPEGGRYHVHAEHCLVEIVDDEGKPTRPGEYGRLLVTGLTNLAMPLLRYDADDLAQAVAGPCPCGRTLPSFGDIIGRYRRVAFLPPGTWAQWGALQHAVGTMSPQSARHLRQYQLQQFRDGSFELRLVMAGAFEAEFAGQVHAAWSEAAQGNPPPLRIVVVDSIPKPAGGKFQNFISDFMPPPDSDRLPHVA